MEINILEDNQKPLLSRREVLAEVSFDAQTPSRPEIRKALASKLKVNVELVIVTNIDTEFGYRKANVDAHVYKNKKDLEAVEPKYMLNRHAEKEKPVEAKPEAEPEEKPADEPEPAEVKEEKPAEEAKETAEPEKQKEEKPAEAAPEKKEAEQPKDEKPADEPKPEQQKPEQKPAEEPKAEDKPEKAE